MKQINSKILKQITLDQKNNVLSPYRTLNENAVRLRTESNESDLIRPAFVRDCEKIINMAAYNRLSDKTQVLSFYRNDDISRRALHVQLVARIARNISRALGLNCDLTEAIALGHDIGHTPFGHAGERFLNQILHERTGRYFSHNVQSARILFEIFAPNVSLQTLDGILCHNGEFELLRYYPAPCTGFDDLTKRMQLCKTTGETAVKKLIPCTLEGCVVRISDVLAYLGKDRQDAYRAHLIKDVNVFKNESGYGIKNGEFLNNFTVDIIENSYGKDHLEMSDEGFCALRDAKKENYDKIYLDPNVIKAYDPIYPMLEKLYLNLYDALCRNDTHSPIFIHHIDYIKSITKKHAPDKEYTLHDKDDIVCDYIASMTDDYFIDLYQYLFPKDKVPSFKSYFE